VPSLAGARVELRHAVKNGDPVWSRGTAWFGDEFLVKYAWSREAAAEVLRGQVVLALRKTAFAWLMPPSST